MSKRMALMAVSLVVVAALGGALAQLQAQPPRSEAVQAGVAGIGVPSCAYCPSPAYPKAALAARYKGNVYVVGVVGVDGRATKIKALDPGLGLGREARDTVKTWRFQPAVGPDGRPVPVATTIAVAFHLPPEKK